MIKVAITKGALMLQGGCCLRVGVVGVNYKTADLALREVFSRICQSISGERGQFFKHPVIVLSTCNRTEFYFSANDLAEAHGDFLSFFRLHFTQPFEHCLYSYFGLDCFVHLVTVCSGLDSAILAETEIQSQVKQAYRIASSGIRLPSSIHYIFQKSFKISKLIRSSVAIEKGSLTFYGAIWQIAKDHISDLKLSRILLVGYSEINRGLVSFLVNKGIRRISIATRDPSQVHVRDIAVVGRELLDDWSTFDWIVCATFSDNYLIRGEKGNGNLILDLSVPRIVDPNLTGVKLWNLEQIIHLVDQNRRLAQEDAQRAHDLIKGEVARSARVYRSKVFQSFKFESIALI